MALLTQVLQRTTQFLQHHDDLKIVEDYGKFAKKMAGHNRHAGLCGLGIGMMMLGVAVIMTVFLPYVPAFGLALAGVSLGFFTTLAIDLLASCIILPIVGYLGFKLCKQGKNTFEEGLNRYHASPYTGFRYKNCTLFARTGNLDRKIEGEIKELDLTTAPY